MNLARQAEAATEIAADLTRIENELIELQADAKRHNLHRADERLERMIACANSTAKGLRLNAGKWSSRATRQASEQ